jgi:hypothetical protein
MENEKTTNINEIKLTCKKIIKIRDLIAKDNFSKQTFDKNLSGFKSQLERLLTLINSMPIKDQPNELTSKMQSFIINGSISTEKETINDITAMAKVFGRQL